MAKLQSGIEEIVKALALMNSQEQSKLLENLAKKDPSIALEIKTKLYQFSDIQYLTPKMLVDFITRINIQDLALCLRIHKGKEQEWILKNVPSSMKIEINSILERPKVKKSQVQEAEVKVMSIFRKMIEKKELIISKDDKYI